MIEKLFRAVAAFWRELVGRRGRAPQFDGWGFAVGSVHGIRDFRVTNDGTLTGVSYQEPWTSGENIARHHSTVVQIRAIFPMRKALEMQLVPIRVPADMGPDCSCGFYAYFKAKWRAFTFGGGGRTIPGVVEAYGKVNLGSKGFRAEKARIKALALRQPWARGVRDSVVYNLLWAAFAVGILLGDATRMAQMPLWIVLFDFVFWGGLAGLYLFAVVDIYRSRKAARKGCPQGDSHDDPPRIRSPFPGFLRGFCLVRGANCRCTWRMLRATQQVSPELLGKIRAKYPDAEVFESIDDMLKAFPLDEPPARESSRRSKS